MGRGGRGRPHQRLPRRRDRAKQRRTRRPASQPVAAAGAPGALDRARCPIPRLPFRGPQHRAGSTGQPRRVADRRGPAAERRARRLETCLRAREEHPTLRNNDLVARLEGDQFAILLDGLKELGHAAVAADRILADSAGAIPDGGREVRLSASIGIASAPPATARAEDVLRDADTALHRAKLLGGNRCEVFDTAALRSAQTELRLESDFDGATRTRRVRALLPADRLAGVESDRRIRGAGALAAPGPGLDPPAGVHSDRREDRIHRARSATGCCARHAASSRRGRAALPRAGNLWVSVNLSGVQLKHPRLVDEIADALRDYGAGAALPACWS